MSADLTPAQAARLEAIEAAPWAEEAAVERVARALYEAWGCRGGWDRLVEPERDDFRRLAVAAIDVMRGATDDGAIGRVHVTVTPEEVQAAQIEVRALRSAGLTPDPMVERLAKAIDAPVTDPR